MQIMIPAIVFVNSVLAVAQVSPSFQNQQRTSGVVGIAAGQTARLNVLYPAAPAPILQPLCSATLSIADSNKVLNSMNFPQITPGQIVSIDVNADTALSGNTRTEIYGFSISPSCNLTVTLEIFDNTTLKTLLAVPAHATFPAPSATRTADR
jgi:hypothetical protein